MVDAVAEPPGGLLEPERRKSPWALGISSPPLKGDPGGTESHPGNGRLWYFFNKTVKTGNETLKGYTISKLSYTEYVENKTTKKIEVTDLDTNEINTYPSISLAGKALGISQGSLSLYIAKKRSSPFRKKYIFKLV